MKSALLAFLLVLSALSIQAQTLPDRILLTNGETVLFFKVRYAPNFLIGYRYNSAGALVKKRYPHERIRTYEQNVAPLSEQDRALLIQRLGSIDTSARWYGVPHETTQPQPAHDPYASEVYQGFQLRFGMGLGIRSNHTPMEFIIPNNSSVKYDESALRLSSLLSLSAGIRAMRGNFVYGLLYNGMLGNSGRASTDNFAHSSGDATIAFDRLAIHYLAPDLGLYFGNQEGGITVTGGFGPFYYTEGLQGHLVPSVDLSNLSIGAHGAFSGFAQITDQLRFIGEAQVLTGRSRFAAVSGEAVMNHLRFSLTVGLALQLGN